MTLMLLLTAFLVLGSAAWLVVTQPATSETKIASPSDRYFSADYFIARSRFRDMVHKAGGRLETLRLESPGPGGEDLGVDIGSFGSENPRRVLLHSSGLHGVEGFAGSAIQLQLLNELPRLSPDTALIIVHALNPYGMAWLRRFNENNVDLNRNFISDETYAGAPPAYASLDSFLNPQSPPALDFYTLRAGLLILRYGMPALSQAVVGGQYEYPKGLFFGGKRLQPGPEMYQSFLLRSLASAQRIVAIDVHTGLGKYAEDTLLVEDNGYETLRQMFGDRITRLDPQQGPAYRIRGGLDSLIPHLKPKAEVFFLTQEFGTYGATKVLHALREENRWQHYGDRTLDHPTKRILKDTFCPPDESWRQSVLKRGRELLAQAMANLE